MSETAAPTQPGFYMYDGGRQTMLFALRSDGQWFVWTDLDTAEVHPCEWGYIEQALGVWNLIRVDSIPMPNQFIDIVFDGSPSHESGRFVEVENEHGHSFNAGRWIAPENDDLFWRLRLNVKPGVNAMGEIIHSISTGKGFSPPSMENLPTKLMLSVSELAEAMEEHRKGRDLVWFQYSRDQRHMHVEHPEEVLFEDGHQFYYVDEELDVTEYVQPLVDQGIAAPGQYYRRGDRWYVMDRVRHVFNIREWAEKGAYDAKPEGVLVELGDSVIRNLHMMHSLIEEAKENDPGFEWTIEKVLQLKIDYNRGREAMHGGNSY